jgi:hypothetical protein
MIQGPIGSTGRVRIGTFKIPTNNPTITLHVPVCASVASETSGKVDAVQLSGSLITHAVFVGSKGATISHESALVAKAPPMRDSRIPDGPLSGSSRFKRVLTKGRFMLEQSLEIKAHSRALTGLATAGGGQVRL